MIGGINLEEKYQEIKFKVVQEIAFFTDQPLENIEEEMTPLFELVEQQQLEIERMKMLLEAWKENSDFWKKKTERYEKALKIVEEAIDF